MSYDAIIALFLIGFVLTMVGIGLALARGRHTVPIEDLGKLPVRPCPIRANPDYRPFWTSPDSNEDTTLLDTDQRHHDST